MKKIAILSFVFSFFLLNTNAFASDFSKAIKTCAPFSAVEDIYKTNAIVNLKITLEKKGNKCIYKENITFSAGSHLMTCMFEQSDLETISLAMEEYYRADKAALDRNKIFQAKMTSNDRLFEKYLTNPKYCNIAADKVSK